jgi:Ala-tRNA(Pro) deacylase
MSISSRLHNYLEDHHIHYKVVTHKYSEGAYDTAVAAHVPMKKLAKAVLLTDHDDKHLLAVLPASNLLSLKKLRNQLDRDLSFVPEEELAVYFADCAKGAIPAIGQAYNVSTIWDDELAEEPEIFIEGGDHEALVRMEKEEFLRLMGDQPHMIISQRGSAHLREARQF